jgi:hypothetical protein
MLSPGMHEQAARFQQLDELTRRVARAAAELQAARELEIELEPPLRAELEALADRLQALQVQLANEAERAWNRAEATIRQRQRGRIMGQIHDATTPDAPLSGPFDEAWQTLGEIKDPDE